MLRCIVTTGTASIVPSGFSWTSKASRTWPVYQRHALTGVATSSASEVTASWTCSDLPLLTHFGYTDGEHVYMKRLSSSFKRSADPSEWSVAWIRHVRY